MYKRQVYFLKEETLSQDPANQDEEEAFALQQTARQVLALVRQIATVPETLDQVLSLHPRSTGDPVFSALGDRFSRVVAMVKALAQEEVCSYRVMIGSARELSDDFL